ncbi:unnamed protein product [Didymodactylos carnosus]|uniref:NAD(P)(+)--arginine ADP-ribosyltransferase n=1 Tax=Didymodactylos carnosus TaxID=1234261 RepID=A0A8S2ELB2_9BILA|nr:unnamed protein product [Didymodactylos carnosus]CAF4020346.1 unnamed protein product [Didymodactylos carnosus]
MAAKDNITTTEINPRYLISVRDEPTQQLKPIAGYEKEELVSLEKAVEPLYELLNINELKENVEIALANSKNPANGLTRDESAAIHLYTIESDLYPTLNHALRAANRRKLLPWFPYLKLFLTALWKIPSTPSILWRGVKEDLSKVYEIGEEYTWWALSSCTSTIKVLECPQYVGKRGKRTIFNIESCNGKQIRPHSYFKEEDEILLLPGTYFEIVSQFSPADDLHIIHLKEKIPPRVLIQVPFDQKYPFQSAPTTEDLYLNDNPWISLDGLKDILSLQQLHLYGCHLTDFPLAITTLLSLKKLDLSRNNLSKIPESIKNLQQLELLDIRFNPIDTLPRELISLKKLRELFLSWTKITDFSGVDLLTSLEVLILDSLGLRQLPKEVGLLRNLKLLSLVGNKLSDSKKNTITNTFKKFGTDIRFEE